MKSKRARFEQDKQKALAHYSRGELQEALRISTRLCTLAEDAAMFCLAGVIYGQIGRFPEAAKYCRKALALSPDYVFAESHLGYALRRLNDLDGARAAFQRVLKKNPADFQVHYQLGLTLESAGEFDGAIACYQAAQRINPGYLDACAGVASVYDKQGDFESAYQAIREHTEPALTNAQIAVLYGRLARKLKLEDRPVEKLERFLENKALQGEDRLQVQFVLGELLDSLGEYDKAFRHFAGANKLKGVHFDSQRFAAKVDELIARFSRSALAEAARATHGSQRQIFIVGMPRSGTTLVEQILASHPSIYGAGELTHLSVIATSLEQRKTDILRLGSEALDQIASSYLDSTNELDRNALRIVDKLPDNFLRLGHIELLFPGARIIHCRRDPLDTCLSCYFRNFSSSLPETFDLEAIGNYYLGYRRLMRHWSEVVSLPILEVEYETLVTEPDDQIRRLIDFTGLAWDDRCLEFQKNKRVANTASYDQVRQAMYTSSVGYWRNYETHLEPLTRLISGTVY